MKIRVKVKPNARSNEVKKFDGDYYEVKVTAAPEKGRANEKVIELLGAYFGVRKSRIEIKSGGRSKEKIIEIE